MVGQRLEALKVPPRFLFLGRFSFIYLLIQFTFRFYLISDNPPGFADSMDVFFDGLLWDIYTLSFLAILPVIYSCAFRHEFYQKKTTHYLESATLFLVTAAFVFITISEFFFWSEFHSRFNFIAVDYLIYTNEVLANIKESFSLYGILLCLSSATIGIFTLTNWLVSPRAGDVSKLTRFSTATVMGVLPVVFSFLIGPWLEFHDDNFHDDQLGKNGLLEFVKAFQANKISYKDFYKTIDDKRVSEILAREVKNFSPAALVGSKPNVVLIIVESLGAKFIEGLGGKADLTPNLNTLAAKSLFFENLYSTGTRTVRGLEAITLSIPPTPGASVVKRPNHKHLYSMGATFGNNGYRPSFFYGGYGYFDNMNSFFENNNFRVIDKMSFAEDEITFTNAWGVCDEDLFRKQRQVAARESSEAPFLHVLLTTSNHRPFTYPEGKIDIPSGTGRMGAVKYTDFAIGEYLRSVSKDHWAQNTVFIIIADHSTEGRGQFELEAADFRIPLWIYSPRLIRPQKISRMVSQIDLLPTLINMLGLTDDSPFVGSDMLYERNTARAFIGNYQYIGYLREKSLTVLGPNKSVKSYSYDLKSFRQKQLDAPVFEEQAISHYQHSSWLLDTDNFKLKLPRL